MEIRNLEWHSHNIEKLRAHSISRREVRELVELSNYNVGVHDDYPGQVRITGYTRGHRYLTIALEDLGGGVYRPITGWNATEAEIRQYIEDTQGTTDPTGIVGPIEPRDNGYETRRP